MDRVENPMVVDSLWSHNKHDYQFEVETRHECADCGDDIEDEGYELNSEYLCKHCLLDRCVVYSWGEVS